MTEVNGVIEAIKKSLREVARTNPEWKFIELGGGKALTALQVIERMEKDRNYALEWVKRANSFSIKQMGVIYEDSVGPTEI